MHKLFEKILLGSFSLDKSRGKCAKQPAYSFSFFVMIFLGCSLVFFHHFLQLAGVSLYDYAYILVLSFVPLLVVWYINNTWLARDKACFVDKSVDSLSVSLFIKSKKPSRVVGFYFPQVNETVPHFLRIMPAVNLLTMTTPLLFMGIYLIAIDILVPVKTYGNLFQYLIYLLVAFASYLPVAFIYASFKLLKIKIKINLMGKLPPCVSYDRSQVELMSACSKDKLHDFWFSSHYDLGLQIGNFNIKALKLGDELNTIVRRYPKEVHTIADAINTVNFITNTFIVETIIKTKKQFKELSNETYTSNSKGLFVKHDWPLISNEKCLLGRKLEDGWKAVERVRYTVRTSEEYGAKTEGILAGRVVNIPSIEKHRFDSDIPANTSVSVDSIEDSVRLKSLTSKTIPELMALRQHVLNDDQLLRVENTIKRAEDIVERLQSDKGWDKDNGLDSLSDYLSIERSFKKSNNIDNKVCIENRYMDSLGDDL